MEHNRAAESIRNAAPVESDNHKVEQSAETSSSGIVPDQVRQRIIENFQKGLNTIRHEEVEEPQQE